MSELVLDRYGAFLGIKDGCFYVSEKGKKVFEISPANLRHISVRVEGVSISASALATAARYGVELTIYRRGRPMSRVIHAALGGGALTRQAQVAAMSNGKGTEAARAFVMGKLHNQRLVIHQRARDALARSDPSVTQLEAECEAIRKCVELLPGAKGVDEIRAYEAQGALHYWKAVSEILRGKVEFAGREVWQPKDPFNKALNIGYGVLRSTVWGATLAANLDPYIGYLHVPHGRHMCLVSDLMEEFRPPVVDRPVIAMALQQGDKLVKAVEGQARDMISAIRGTLNDNDRLFERAIYEQARQLASYLRGAEGAYEPYKLRW